MALAGLPRFAHLYPQFNESETVAFLTEQTTQQIINLVLPD
jgi:hypothetical protein